MIRVSPALRLADRAQSDDILAIQEDFSCGAASHLSREIYAAGNVTIGTGSKLQALAADGDVTLASEVEVARWVDSWGELRLGRNCVIHSRATSRKSVCLEAGVQARSVFAPEITYSAGSRWTTPAIRSHSQDQRLQIPPAAGADPGRSAPDGTGLVEIEAARAGVLDLRGFAPAQGARAFDRAVGGQGRLLDSGRQFTRGRPQSLRQICSSARARSARAT